jgi:hypothetical protein
LRGSGSTDSQGRVEVYHNKQWGTVCNNIFKKNHNGANIICRMLGFALGTSVNNCGPSHARQNDDPLLRCYRRYGAGSGKIWLDDVDCVGNESSLFDCRHKLWERNGCSHEEDVEVVCSGTVYLFKSLIR